MIGTAQMENGGKTSKMLERKKVIEEAEEFIKHLAPDDKHKRHIGIMVNLGWIYDVLALLKEQEAREPHYTTLKYLVDGKEVVVHHPECPRCIENGLMLWDAEIERGQAFCKRCGQEVKWNE